MATKKQKWVNKMNGMHVSVVGVFLILFIIAFNNLLSNGSILPGNNSKVKFKKHVLSQDFFSEGVATGDINNDGVTDIIAGPYWFEAPDWEAHEISAPKTFKPKGEYCESFQNFTLDVNLDGWLDVIRVEFPGETGRWFENPGGKDKHWEAHVIAEDVCNESPLQVDVDKDGRQDLLFAECDGGPGQMVWMKAPTKKNDLSWKKFSISKEKAPGTQRFSHGLGWSDVNGDGREDVIIAKGWWQTPSNPQKGDWQFNEADFGGRAAQMHTYDFDADGDMDVISSYPHDYGIRWYEQKQNEQGKTTWTSHLISEKFSQTHALNFTDMDDDGDPDLVTGKRHFAHHGKDPGGKEPAVLYWFEFSRNENNEPVWTPHQIDDNSGIGVEFVVKDITGDNGKDIIIANKKGVFFFERMQ